jgi:hypothetical protein
VTPDVLPARVDELDLEVVRPTHAAQLKRDRVVLAQLMVHRTAGDDESRPSLEVVIEAQRGAATR